MSKLFSETEEFIKCTSSVGVHDLPKNGAVILAHTLGEDNKIEVGNLRLSDLALDALRVILNNRYKKRTKS